MAGRKRRAADNRRRFHEGRVLAARTPREELWALCFWLVTEAFHAGPEALRSASGVVRTMVDELVRERR